MKRRSSSDSPNLVHVLGKRRIETRSFTWAEGCVPGYRKGDMPEKERGEIQRTQPKIIPVINLMFQLLLSAAFRTWKIKTKLSGLLPPFITGITSLDLGI